MHLTGFPSCSYLQPCVDVFSQAKNFSTDALVRSFQLAFSLRSISLARGRSFSMFGDQTRESFVSVIVESLEHLPNASPLF
ncbi:hypothetical protein Nepgr_010011 [Nepenthes gracilis]|uniref:Uncharacterized protein n=1 Tax=Nepenthes gracilis TaxID=150966 RepID=A0AAD3SC62_NEPGR|nr:hypothetical protein Nepgr_010011 [Nepenthes gracilis]